MNNNSLRPVLHAQSSDLALDKRDNSLLRTMVAPAGDSEITCGCGEDSCAVVTIRVDSSTAKVLDANLSKINADNSPQKALFDFEHEHKQAMAWPIGFEWSSSPKPGVYSTAELSSLGREYVNGKVVRSFSLSFYTDADLPKRKDVKRGVTYQPKSGQRGSMENPARITGLCFPYAGTLTNDPAFRGNLPVIAVRRVRRVSPELAATYRNIARELGKRQRLLLERNHQLLKQLIRPPTESEERIAAVDRWMENRRKQ